MDFTIASFESRTNCVYISNIKSGVPLLRKILTLLVSIYSSVRILKFDRNLLGIRIYLYVSVNIVVLIVICPKFLRDSSF